MIWCKTYTQGNNSILAIADEDLMNKVFEEGDCILTIGNFYKGELKTKEAIIELLDKATIINAVGLKSTSLLVEQKIISQEHIQKIGGISHIQILVRSKDTA